MLAVVAALVTTHKATLRLELAALAAVVMAGQITQMAATELQIQVVVVGELLLIGREHRVALAAQA
jgi:hypothetical protein